MSSSRPSPTLLVCACAGIGVTAVAAIAWRKARSRPPIDSAQLVAGGKTTEAHSDKSSGCWMLALARATWRVEVTHPRSPRLSADSITLALLALLALRAGSKVGTTAFAVSAFRAIETVSKRKLSVAVSCLLDARVTLSPRSPFRQHRRQGLPLPLPTFLLRPRPPWRSPPRGSLPCKCAAPFPSRTERLLFSERVAD